ncbi:MAG TPA: hypothetical protein VGA51_17390 [Casimicrobiaceae bacterium]
MNASYYRQLARDLMADAAVAEDPKIAARFRERAEEYLLLAEALDEPVPLPLPASEPERRPVQQQQQVQRNRSDDTRKCDQCGGNMKRAASVPKVGAYPQLDTFKCLACDHVITDVVE